MAAFDVLLELRLLLELRCKGVQRTQLGAAVASVGNLVVQIPTHGLRPAGVVLDNVRKRVLGSQVATGVGFGRDMADKRRMAWAVELLEQVVLRLHPALVDLMRWFGRLNTLPGEQERRGTSVFLKSARRPERHGRRWLELFPK